MKTETEPNMIKTSRIILSICIYLITFFFAIALDNVLIIGVTLGFSVFSIFSSLRYYYLKSNIYTLSSRKFLDFISGGQSLFLREDSFGKLKFFRCSLNRLSGIHESDEIILIKHSENLVDGNYEVVNIENAISLKLKIAD